MFSLIDFFSIVVYYVYMFKHVNDKEAIKLFRQVGPLFTALGDVNRQLIIIQLLQVSKLSVNEFAEVIPLSRPAISHHLKILLQSGLVAVRQQGKQRLYYLDHSSIDQIMALENLAKTLRECSNNKQD